MVLQVRCHGNTSQCKVCCVTGEVWVCYGNMSQCKVYCVTGEVSRQHESV